MYVSEKFKKNWNFCIYQLKTLKPCLVGTLFLMFSYVEFTSNYNGVLQYIIISILYFLKILNLMSAKWQNNAGHYRGL